MSNVLRTSFSVSSLHGPGTDEIIANISGKTRSRGNPFNVLKGRWCPLCPARHAQADRKGLWKGCDHASREQRRRSLREWPKEKGGRRLMLTISTMLMVWECTGGDLDGKSRIGRCPGCWRTSKRKDHRDLRPREQRKDFDLSSCHCRGPKDGRNMHLYRRRARPRHTICPTVCFKLL